MEEWGKNIAGPTKRPLRCTMRHLTGHRQWNAPDLSHTFKQRIFTHIQTELGEPKMSRAVSGWVVVVERW